MHNGFEPFNPTRALKYFNSAKCIVVDRDPRDIFMTSVSYSEGFNDRVNRYKRIAGAHDIGLFIDRFKIYRRNIHREAESEHTVMRMRFEDLIYHYEETLTKLYNFLEVDSRAHKRKREFFSPEVSKRNTRLWENSESDVSESIKRIESELGEYCFEY